VYLAGEGAQGPLGTGLYPDGYTTLVFYYGGENECSSFGFWVGGCGTKANEAGDISEPFSGAQAAAGTAGAQWVTEAGGTQVTAVKGLLNILQKPAEVAQLEPQAELQATPVWPSLATAEGQQVKNTIKNYPNYEAWVTHQAAPQEQPYDPVANPASAPEPSSPSPDPNDPPITDPTVPAPAPTGCMTPLSTVVDFSPISAAGLQNKFPFAVFAWLHTTLSGWAGTATAPSFTLNVLGQSMHFDMALGNGAMVIIRAGFLAITLVALVWWLGTALLGLSEGARE
jgi:hypothetical protein